MLLQSPGLSDFCLRACHPHQPNLIRVTRTSRSHICRKSRAAAVDTAQVIEEETDSSNKFDLNISARSPEAQSPANPEPGFKMQIPRNKVLTTNMIAKATNKDVSQVCQAPEVR